MAAGTDVVVLTARHSISGQVMLDQRLSDFLNDRRDTAINLRETKIARLNEPSRILQQHAESVIQKAWAVVAFEPPSKGVNAGQRLFGYVPKLRHQAFLVLEGMEVRGTLHTAGPLDLRRLLATTSDSFVPITDAVVTLYENDRYVIEQPAIMVNIRLLRYIGTIG
ncbi:MAG: hypothetical protein HZB51_17090 [Chloroflexi bacterium]|nr:hypothetical protein [Chloroflexota bacterium]